MPEEPGDSTDISDPGSDEFWTDRRKFIGTGLAALLGLGSLGYAASKWNGGKAEPEPIAPTTETPTETPTESPTETPTPTETETPTPTSTPTSTPTETETPAAFTYQVNEDEQTVSFNTQYGDFTLPYDPQEMWYSQEEADQIEFGVQDNGDLVALDSTDKIVYEFEADTHPNPNIFEWDSHPLEEMYAELDRELSQLPEDAAKQISEVGENWKDNDSYKAVEVEEVLDHFSGYEEGEAMFTNYFFDFQASGKREEPVYEDEFQHLLGIDQSKGSEAQDLLSGRL